MTAQQKHEDLSPKMERLSVGNGPFGKTRRAQKNQAIELEMRA